MKEHNVHVYFHKFGKVVVEFEGFTAEEEASLRANKDFMQEMMNQHEKIGDFTMSLEHGIKAHE